MDAIETLWLDNIGLPVEDLDLDSIQAMAEFISIYVIKAANNTSMHYVVQMKKMVPNLILDQISQIALNRNIRDIDDLIDSIADGDLSSDDENSNSSSDEEDEDEDGNSSSDEEDEDEDGNSSSDDEEDEDGNSSSEEKKNNSASMLRGFIGKKVFDKTTLLNIAVHILRKDGESGARIKILQKMLMNKDVEKDLSPYISMCEEELVNLAKQDLKFLLILTSKEQKVLNNTCCFILKMASSLRSNNIPFEDWQSENLRQLFKGNSFGVDNVFKQAVIRRIKLGERDICGKKATITIQIGKIVKNLIRWVIELPIEPTSNSGISLTEFLEYTTTSISPTGALFLLDIIDVSIVDIHSCANVINFPESFINMNYSEFEMAMNKLLQVYVDNKREIGVISKIG